MLVVDDIVRNQEEKLMGKKYGLSFSWKRLLGISGLKGKVAKKTGIPLTKSGVERKIGRTILDILFKSKPEERR